MPKMLVIEATVVNHHDDRGGQHVNVGDIVDLTKQDAIDLARIGRLLYTRKEDDPTKAGEFTASAELVKAAKEMAKTAGKDAAADKQD